MAGYEARRRMAERQRALSLSSALQAVEPFITLSSRVIDSTFGSERMLREKNEGCIGRIQVGWSGKRRRLDFQRANRRQLP